MPSIWLYLHDHYRLQTMLKKRNKSHESIMVLDWHKASAIFLRMGAKDVNKLSLALW